MPIPQVNDRIKEAPVVVLRAVFAGIGQILLTADKVRARAAEQVWTPDRLPAPGLRSAAPGPRNGTTHAEPAVAEHSAIREAPVSPAPAPAAKATPATKITSAPKTTRATKPAPAAKTTRATKPAPTTKAAPAPKAVKTVPAPRAPKAEPVAVEPVAVEPVAVEPVAVEPVAVEPVAVEPVAVEPVAVEPVAVEPVAVEPVAVEPVAVEPVAVEPVAVEPPLPGWDGLSLASLRARLRGFDAPTIRAMLAYEQAHARREPVITMLERRLAKITAG